MELGAYVCKYTWNDGAGIKCSSAVHKLHHTQLFVWCSASTSLSPIFGYFLAGKNKCVYLYFIFEKNFIPIYRAILLFPQIYVIRKVIEPITN